MQVSCPGFVLPSEGTRRTAGPAEARDDELAPLRAASEHEHEHSGEGCFLEPSASSCAAHSIDQLLRNQAIEPQDGPPQLPLESRDSRGSQHAFTRNRRGRNPVPEEADAIVPKITLLQAAPSSGISRQGIHLARDIASQVNVRARGLYHAPALGPRSRANDLAGRRCGGSILAPLGPRQT